MRFQVTLGGRAHEVLQLGKDLLNGLRSELSGERKKVEAGKHLYGLTDLYGSKCNAWERLRRMGSRPDSVSRDHGTRQCHRFSSRSLEQKSGANVPTFLAATDRTRRASSNRGAPNVCSSRILLKKSVQLVTPRPLRVSAACICRFRPLNLRHLFAISACGAPPCFSMPLWEPYR
jgi:hypothetical protein